jgi:hypothetical protein
MSLAEPPGVEAAHPQTCVTLDGLPSGFDQFKLSCKVRVVAAYPKAGIRIGDPEPGAR